MRYSGRANWGFTVIFLYPIISIIFNKEPFVYLLLSSIILVLALVAILNVKKSVTIEESKLIYDAHLFRLHIIHIELPTSDIRLIEFHLAGWFGRNAKVKGKYARFHYHFINFKPLEFYNELEQFAIRNNIPYIKTKEYTTIEKMVPRS